MGKRIKMNFRKMWLATVATIAVTMPAYAAEKPVATETTTSETHVNVQPTYEGGGGGNGIPKPFVSGQWTPTEAMQWIASNESVSIQMTKLIREIAEKEKVAMSAKSYLVAANGMVLVDPAQEYVQDICKMSDMAEKPYHTALAAFHRAVGRVKTLESSDLTDARDDLWNAAAQYSKMLNECTTALSNSVRLTAVAIAKR
jgi:hypothetical protein